MANFTIKNKMREHRARLNLRQRDLAEKIGVTRASVVNFERNNHKISLETAFLIAGAFGVKVEDVFYLETL